MLCNVQDLIEHGSNSRPTGQVWHSTAFYVICKSFKDAALKPALSLNHISHKARRFYEMTNPTRWRFKSSQQPAILAMENLHFTVFLLATFAVAQLYVEVGIFIFQVMNLSWNASRGGIPCRKVTLIAPSSK